MNSPHSGHSFFGKLRKNSTGLNNIITTPYLIQFIFIYPVVVQYKQKKIFCVDLFCKFFDFLKIESFITKNITSF